MGGALDFAYYLLQPPGLQSLLASSLSADFSLDRGYCALSLARRRSGADGESAGDLAAVRQVDEVSTSEIETKIKQLLTGPAQSQTQFRP